MWSTTSWRHPTPPMFCLSGHVPSGCSSQCALVTLVCSGALKRLMMLDLQRVEDEKLLQLPRLNPVTMILDVLSDRELPQVAAASGVSVLVSRALQLLRKSYGRVVEIGDDGWECTCMMCGREGQLLMCEHGMQPTDAVAQCPKVAHAKCMGLSDAPAVFICPLHAETCCAMGVKEKLDAKSRALDESISVPHTQVMYCHAST